MSPEHPLIVGGRYGLGSHDTTPAQIISVFNNLAMPEPKNHFTIGIVDDVTFTSLPEVEEIALGATPTSTARLTSLTTLRSQEVSPALTCVSVIHLSVLPTW